MTGKELKTYREKAGMTQKELGQLIGKQPSTVNKWEKGTNQIPPRLVQKIISAINHIYPLLITSEAETAMFHKIGAAEQHPPHYKRQNERPEIETLFLQVAKRFSPVHRYEIVEVEGSSMEPTLHSGDLLLCRWISPDDIGNGHTGDPSARIYVVFTNRADLAKERPSGKWVKRVTHIKEINRFTCRSDNIDSIESFNTFQLDRSEIVDIWYPVLKLSWNLSNPHRDLYNRMDLLENRIELLELLTQKTKLI